MVYESDFYTTRRAGSHYARPTISSYTVTTPLRYSGVPRDFEDEKREIRNSSAMLLRQLNDPVPRVMAPQVQASGPAAEPNLKKWVYDPFSSHNKYNSDTYVKSTITDPLRSVARDIEAMARYHSPASRYVGKNHLASTRIIGSKAYPKTKPRIYNYDTARVGREVNVMSHYSANRSQAKSDVDEVIASYRRKLLLSTLIRNAKRSLMLYESWNKSKLNKNKK
uniref:Uncharacterized protein n=1 Tax=Culex tarsalis TaxID=7177 RepID=A0A1Q3FVL5_CULTA